MEFSPLNKKLIEELTSFLESNQSPLKTSDLVIALTAKLNDATLITWDRELSRAATHSGCAVAPAS